MLFDVVVVVVVVVVAFAIAAAATELTYTFTFTNNANLIRTADFYGLTSVRGTRDVTVETYGAPGGAG